MQSGQGGQHFQHDGHFVQRRGINSQLTAPCEVGSGVAVAFDEQPGVHNSLQVRLIGHVTSSIVFQQGIFEFRKELIFAALLQIDHSVHFEVAAISFRPDTSVQCDLSRLHLPLNDFTAAKNQFIFRHRVRSVDVGDGHFKDFGLVQSNMSGILQVVSIPDAVCDDHSGHVCQIQSRGNGTLLQTHIEAPGRRRRSCAIRHAAEIQFR